MHCTPQRGWSARLVFSRKAPYPSPCRLSSLYNAGIASLVTRRDDTRCYTAQRQDHEISQIWPRNVSKSPVICNWRCMLTKGHMMTSQDDGGAEQRNDHIPCPRCGGSGRTRFPVQKYAGVWDRFANKQYITPMKWRYWDHICPQCWGSGCIYLNGRS